MPKRRRPQLRRRETDEEMATRLQREEDARAGALFADSIHMQLLAAVSSAFGSSAAAMPPPPRVRRRTHSRHHQHRSFEESGGGEDDDYEWYLEHLEDVKVGLSPAALRSMPSYRFATIAATDKATAAAAAAAEAANADADACSRRCAICMCDFEQDEEVRRLPCLDLFHAACVDHWLAEHTTCPVCRCDVRDLLADSAQHQHQHQQP